MVYGGNIDSRSRLSGRIWRQAQYNTDDHESCGLFRDGISGQREAERMNKTVKTSELLTETNSRIW
jgi:hypothetical protein